MMAINWLLALASVLRLAGFVTEPHLDDHAIHAIVGHRALVPAPAGGHGGLTVVTWNIERGERFERIASVLSELDADVVLLQEVDRGCGRSGDRDVARELAAQLGMNWAGAGEFQEIGEGRRGAACITGQATLSRAPIDDASVIRFAGQSAKWRFNPFQPRRGARIALRTTIAGVVFYNLHLESGDGSARLRSRQMDDVRSDLFHRGSSRAIVAGDFNNAGAEPALALEREGLVSVLTSDRTAAAARRPIDWIFVRGLAGEGSVVRVVGASDHDPIVARLTTRHAANTPEKRREKPCRESPPDSNELVPALTSVQRRL